MWDDSEVAAATEDDEFLYGEVELQIGALDAVMGVAPIGVKTDPRAAFADGKYTWTSGTNPDSSLEWTDEGGDTLKAWYPSKINTHDFYNVSIRYAPVVRSRSPTRLTCAASSSSGSTRSGASHLSQPVAANPFTA